MAETTALEKRIEDKIDTSLVGGIRISTQSGMLVENTAQAMEVAKLMSISKTAVPAHVRNNPGVCFALTVQAWEWAMNPFAVANKSYVVNDRLCYEAALYNAVATRRAPIVGRLSVSYDGQGDTRRCTVKARLRPEEGGAEVEYTSPMFKTINPKNSPLWKNDPDQQLFYFSVRAFVRRHFADVMMGVYTVDEIQDAPEQPTVIVQSATSRTDRLAARLGATAAASQAEQTQEETDEQIAARLDAARRKPTTADTSHPDTAGDADGEPQPTPQAHTTDAPAQAEDDTTAGGEPAGADAEGADGGTEPSVWEQAIAAQAAVHGVEPGAAEVRLTQFCRQVYKKSPESLDAKRLADLLAKVQAGDISK